MLTWLKRVTAQEIDEIADERGAEFLHDVNIKEFTDGTLENWNVVSNEIANGRSYQHWMGPWFIVNHHIDYNKIAEIRNIAEDELREIIASVFCNWTKHE